MRDFALIISKDIRIMLNYFKAIRHNPKRMMLVILYIGYFGWMVWMNSNNAHETPLQNRFELVSLMAMGFCAFTLLINIQVNLKEMLSFFKPADIQIVFTSPLKPRAVFAAALLKSLLGAMLLTLFILLMASQWLFASGIDIWRYLLIVFIFMTFNMMIQPLNFILIRLKTRLPVVIAQTLFTGIWLLPTLLLISYNRFNIFAFIQSPLTQWIPIIGWIKGLIDFSYGMASPNVHWLMVLYFGFVASTFIFALVLANDYYESVIEGTENLHQLKQKAKEGRSQGKGIQLFKNRKLTFKGNHQGADALYWKQRVIANKKDISYLFGMKEMLFILGAVTAVIITQVWHDDWEWVVYACNGAVLYATLLFSIANKNQAEFLTSRFLMMPSKGTQKLFALFRLDIMRFVVMVALLNIILIFAKDAQPLHLTALFIGQILVYLQILYVNIFVMIFFQNSTDYNLMMPIMKIIQLLIIVVPSIAVAIAAGALTESVIVVIGAVSAVNLLMILAFMLLTGYMVNRIEASR